MTYHFREFYVPDRMVSGIENWVLYGIKPGGFLTAILENDLRAACEYADEENLKNIPAFISYLYNAAPASCWGSIANVKAWRESKAAEREIEILNPGRPG